nr:MAG TPA: hypothetical protein [Caudoviricetes sp.]
MVQLINQIFFYKFGQKLLKTLFFFPYLSFQKVCEIFPVTGLPYF